MIWLLLLLIFLPVETFSSDDRPPLLGHNLSNTAYVLDKGECTVGFLHAGCGVSEDLTVGTSPFISLYYQMNSLAIRYKIEENSSAIHTVQSTYFKSISDWDSDPDTRFENRRSYEMEALWLMYIYARKYNSHFTLHYNLQLNYYFEETMPISMRRPYRDPEPLQINPTMLFELNLIEGFFIQGELGLLDILNDPLHTHAGVSIGRKWSWGYAYFGFSYTSATGAYFSPVNRRDQQETLRESSINGYETVLTNSQYNEDYAIHPELTIQVFF